MIPDKLNPCKPATEGKWLADGLYWLYERLNKGAESCPCCSFFRGAAIFGVAGFLIGYLVRS